MCSFRLGVPHLAANNYDDQYHLANDGAALQAESAREGQRMPRVGGGELHAVKLNPGSSHVKFKS